ncbi:hypothetical protein V1521DRAFT_442730 [Lipomyces starkeyi]
MTVENFEDMDSDVELEEYAFDSELVQTMNALAMLRYDKEGDKKLKAQQSVVAVLQRATGGGMVLTRKSGLQV